MRSRPLLRLYPREWRERYGDELEALVGPGPLTLPVALDLLRGAVDAHLHPELATPALVAAGGGTIPLLPRTPRMRAGVLLPAVLFGLLAFGLAQPNPVLPIILPIGAHASSASIAQARYPTLPIRASIEKNGIAAVFLARGPQSAVVVSTRAATLGWMDAGGGASIGTAATDEHPMTFGVTSGANNENQWITISGTVIAPVASVALLYPDGSREVLPLHDGAFLWFETRPSPFRTPLQGSAFGRLPSEIVASDAAGNEFARLPLHLGN